LRRSKDDPLDAAQSPVPSLELKTRDPEPETRDPMSRIEA
jgi:hypothetical protein